MEVTTIEPEPFCMDTKGKDLEPLNVKVKSLETEGLPWHCINRNMFDVQEEKHKQEGELVPFLDFSFFPTAANEEEDNEEAEEGPNEGGDKEGYMKFLNTDESFPALDLDLLDSFDQTSTSEYDDDDQLDFSMMISGKDDPSSSNSDNSSSSNSDSVDLLSPANVVLPDKCHIKDFQEEKWNVRYKELLEFIKEKGHAAVPHTYPENQPLARWVKRQRRQHKLMANGKASPLTPERIDLLRSVDFVWDSHDVQWRENLQALEEFRQRNGHCNVPTKYKDKKLAIWVKCQRRQYKLFWDGKSSAMSLERIQELEKRGFKWELRSTSAP